MSSSRAKGLTLVCHIYCNLITIFTTKKKIIWHFRFPSIFLASHYSNQQKTHVHLYILFQPTSIAQWVAKLFPRFSMAYYWSLVYFYGKSNFNFIHHSCANMYQMLNDIFLQPQLAPCMEHRQCSTVSLVSVYTSQKTCQLSNHGTSSVIYREVHDNPVSQFWLYLAQHNTKLF
jgi:hypothetical protein